MRVSRDLDTYSLSTIRATHDDSTEAEVIKAKRQLSFVTACFSLTDATFHFSLTAHVYFAEW